MDVEDSSIPETSHCHCCGTTYSLAKASSHCHRPMTSSLSAKWTCRWRLSPSLWSWGCLLFMWSRCRRSSAETSRKVEGVSLPSWWYHWWGQRCPQTRQQDGPHRSWIHNHLWRRIATRLWPLATSPSIVNEYVGIQVDGNNEVYPSIPSQL